MTPIYQQLAHKYNSVVFGHVETSRVDVENLNGVPAFVAYKDSQPVEMVLGARREALVDMIEQKLIS